MRVIGKSVSSGARTSVYVATHAHKVWCVRQFVAEAHNLLAKFLCVYFSGHFKGDNRREIL